MKRDEWHFVRLDVSGSSQPSLSGKGSRASVEAAAERSPAIPVFAGRAPFSNVHARRLGSYWPQLSAIRRSNRRH